MTKTAEQIALAWRVADFIQAYPDKHQQASWVGGPAAHKFDELWFNSLTFDDVYDSCGTTACAAGWTVLLSGYEFVSRIDVGKPGEMPMPIWHRAADLLGLDGDEAEALFHFAWTRDDVIRQIEKIFGPRPFVPGYDAVTP